MLYHKEHEVLFSKRPSFLKLLELDFFDKEKNITINVWRNHGIEPLIPLMRHYFALRNLYVDFQISSYDDSFSFADYIDATVEVLWLDPNILLANSSSDKWSDWLSERMNFLRKISSSPIILVSWIEPGISVKNSIRL